LENTVHSLNIEPAKLGRPVLLHLSSRVTNDSWLRRGYKTTSN